MGNTEPLAMPRKSALDRLLSLFTDLRPGEGLTAIMLASNLFCLLALYSILKPVRSALMLSQSTAEIQTYLAAAQALLLLFLVPLYGRLASSMNRVRLIGGVTLFFASNLVIFSLLGRAGVRVGIAYFIWLGIFNMMAPAQLWAFANDIYTSERGKRLLPIVGIGASTGAWIGAEIASALFTSMGPYLLMLLGTGGLVICLVLTILIDRRERMPHQQGGEETKAEQPLGRAGGFQLVFSQKYLLYIALLMMVLNTVNTLGGYLLESLVQRESVQAATAAGLDTATWIGGFMARFQANVNLLGLLMQMFLVSRIFKYFGVRTALFILPAIAMLSYGVMAFLPLLSIVRLAKTLENSTDYSVQNTTRQALFLPTSREAKYKAKQAIDAFFVRAGDMFPAAIVAIGGALSFATQHYAVVNLAFIVVWILLAVGIAREHRKLSADSPDIERAA